MKPTDVIELSPAHALLWHRFTTNYHNKRLAHAILLVGSLHRNLADFARQMAMALFCKHANSPCGQCQSCLLIKINEHPDLSYLAPEKINTAIKIDQVRFLQSILFTSTQLGGNRVVIINPAEKMNGAAANALLKILEEPPDNTHFILIAEHLSTIVPTILSRCQQWHLPDTNNICENYLSQGSLYLTDSDRGKMFAQIDVIINNLIDLQKGSYSTNALAAKWAEFELNDLIWLLYLINAQMIYDFFYGVCSKTSVAVKMLSLANYFKPVRLFSQIDKLNGIIRNLNHTVSMNQLLLLEDLLAGYL